MSHESWACVTVCFGLALALFVMALRRLGIARVALRATHTDLADARPGARRLLGRLEGTGSTVLAPFTDRHVLWVHAVLRGVGPEGGAPRVLWEKTLHAPVRLVDGDAQVDLDLGGATVLVTREYRHGAVRALLPAVRLMPRVLARAGYRDPPPSHQWFHLEEEVVMPRAAVSVLGWCDRSGRIVGHQPHALVVSDLTPWRMVLRLAWGPVLAALMSLILALTGASVLAAAWWLRA